MAKALTKMQTKKKKALFIKTAQENHGIIHASLKACGLTRYYYDIWRKNDPDFYEATENFTNMTAEYVESKLLKLIDEGDRTAIIFYLKCQAQHMGYIDKQVIEQTTTFAQPVQLNIIAPQPNQIEGNDPKQIDNE